MEISLIHACRYLGDEAFGYL